MFGKWKEKKELKKQQEAEAERARNEAERIARVQLAKKIATTMYQSFCKFCNNPPDEYYYAGDYYSDRRRYYDDRRGCIAFEQIQYSRDDVWKETDYDFHSVSVEVRPYREGSHSFPRSVTYSYVYDYDGSLYSLMCDVKAELQQLNPKLSLLGGYPERFERGFCPVYHGEEGEISVFMPPEEKTNALSETNQAPYELTGVQAKIAKKFYKDPDAIKKSVEKLSKFLDAVEKSSSTGAQQASASSELSEDNSNIGKITCPFPGTVIRTFASAGKSVKKGDLICVIEAMLMESDIVSDIDGIVISIDIKVGDSVCIGDILCVIEKH